MGRKQVNQIQDLIDHGIDNVQRAVEQYGDEKNEECRGSLILAIRNLSDAAAGRLLTLAWFLRTQEAAVLESLALKHGWVYG